MPIIDKIIFNDENYEALQWYGKVLFKYLIINASVTGITKLDVSRKEFRKEFPENFDFSNIAKELQCMKDKKIIYGFDETFFILNYKKYQSFDYIPTEEAYIVALFFKEKTNIPIFPKYLDSVKNKPKNAFRNIDSFIDNLKKYLPLSIFPVQISRKKLPQERERGVESEMKPPEPPVHAGVNPEPKRDIFLSAYFSIYKSFTKQNIPPNETSSLLKIVNTLMQNCQTIEEWEKTLMVFFERAINEHFNPTVINLARFWIEHFK